MRFPHTGITTILTILETYVNLKDFEYAREIIKEEKLPHEF